MIERKDCKKRGGEQRSRSPNEIGTLKTLPYTLANNISQKNINTRKNYLAILNHTRYTHTDIQCRSKGKMIHSYKKIALVVTIMHSKFQIKIIYHGTENLTLTKFIWHL